jgi:hypothetical protein
MGIKKHPQKFFSLTTLTEIFKKSDLIKKSNQAKFELSAEFGLNSSEEFHQTEKSVPKG